MLLNPDAAVPVQQEEGSLLGSDGYCGRIEMLVPKRQISREVSGTWNLDHTPNELKSFHRVMISPKPSIQGPQLP
jgi:hypothetical protein